MSRKRAAGVRATTAQRPVSSQRMVAARATACGGGRKHADNGTRPRDGLKQRRRREAARRGKGVAPRLGSCGGGAEQ